MSAATQVLTKELKGKVLVASPYAPLREQMLRTLAVPNASVSEAQGGADALLKLEKSDYGTLLLDPRIEDLDVGELMATLRGRYPNLTSFLWSPTQCATKLPHTQRQTKLPQRRKN